MVLPCLHTQCGPAAKQRPHSSRPWVPPLLCLPLACSMLICSVFSRPQLNAVLGKMTKEAAEVHGRRLSVNPTGT